MCVDYLVRDYARRLRNCVAAVGVVAALSGIVALSPARASSFQCSFASFCADGFIGQTGFTASSEIDRSAHSQLRDIVNQIQSGRGRAGLPRGFAALDPDDLDPQLLGYSSKSRSGKASDAFAAYTKAPPRAAAGSNVTYAAWGQGFYERENRDGQFQGVDIGRRTRTSGGIFGIDAVISGIRHMTDAVVIGVLGGVTESRVRDNLGSNTRVDGPSFGVYGAYVDGGFSLDGVVKVDSFDVLRTAAGAADLNISMTNYSVSMNVNNKIPLQNAWWFEPTAGFSYTRSIWDSRASALGFQDGTEVRIQGGARAGTSWTSGGVRIEPTFGAIAYSPIIVDGGSVATAGVPSAPTDAGKLFGLFNGKLNVVWNKYWATYVEGEARLSNNIDAFGARVGGRWTFNPS